MALQLGSFMGGLFGGAQSVMGLAQAVNNYNQQTNAQNAAAAAVDSANSQPSPTYTPINQTDPGASTPDQSQSTAYPADPSAIPAQPASSPAGNPADDLLRTEKDYGTAAQKWLTSLGKPNPSATGTSATSPNIAQAVSPVATAATSGASQPAPKPALNSPGYAGGVPADTQSANSPYATQYGPAKPAAPQPAAPSIPNADDPGYAGGVAPQASAVGAGAPQAAQQAQAAAVYGDSIANGLQTATGAPGATQPGIPPTGVTQQIANDTTNIQGANVALSSGVSNDPTPRGLAEVQKQIALLKSKGAASVTLLGVGAKFAGLNGPLQQIAQQSGALFQPIQSGPDGVHPPTGQAYAQLAQQMVSRVQGQDQQAQAQPQQPSVGARILSALNPISSAQAGELPPQQPGQASQPAPSQPPASSATGAQGPAPAAAQPSATPETDAALQRIQAGQPAPSTPAPAGTPAAQPAAQGAQPSATGTATLPAPAAKITPDQQGPTQQSEAPARYQFPPLNPRPYTALGQQGHAEHVKMIDQVAQEEGVSPQRLALHWYQESSMNAKGTTPMTSGKAVGPMQLTPGVYNNPLYNPGGQLDPHKLPDAMRIAARYIKDLDTHYGTDSPASVVGYQQGPGGANTWQQAAQNGTLDQWNKDHPTGALYLSRAMPGQQFGAQNVRPPINMPVQPMVEAMQNNDVFAGARYLAQTAPGVTMTDKMKAAEAALVSLAAGKGDIQGMVAARNFIFDLSRQNTNQSMINGYKALQAGDIQGAAQNLAAAHTFFPDGTMGRFGVSADGKHLIAERLDESTGKPLGKPFEVTPQGLQSTMYQTRDPNAYAEFVSKQQAEAAQLRFMEQHGEYYSGLLAERAKANETTANARIQVAETQAQSRVDAAEVRAATAEQQHRAALDQKNDTIDKELGNATATPAINALPGPTKGIASVVYGDLRRGDRATMTTMRADDIAAGLFGGRYSPAQDKDGQAYVVDNSGRPVARLSPQAFRQLSTVIRPLGAAAQAAPQRSAVGGGSAVPPIQSAIGMH